MKHYVCGGDCGGESSKPGVCQSEGCSQEGQPLVACTCEDGLHAGTGRSSEDEGKTGGEEIVDQELADDE